jgi:hypothetical protein
LNSQDNNNKSSIKDISEINPTLKAIADPAIKSFIENDCVDIERPVTCVIATDVKILKKIQHQACIYLSQGSVSSEMVYQSDFFVPEENCSSLEERDFLAVLMHIVNTLCSSQNIELQVKLPNVQGNYSNDFTTEIKRTVEWFHTIERMKYLSNYQQELAGSNISWKEKTVSIGADRKLTWDTAEEIIKNHLASILKPFLASGKRGVQILLENKSVNLLEKALFIRVITRCPTFLENVTTEDANYLCSFLWDSENAAAYSSKVSMYRKYITDEVIRLVDDEADNVPCVDFDPFNITEVIANNRLIVKNWAESHELSSEQVNYICSTFGNGGYRCTKHYNDSMAILGALFASSSKENRVKINDMVISSSELEEMYIWASLSNQKMSGIAMHCITCDNVIFSSFAKGVLLQKGYGDIINLIDTKEQLRAICRLFSLDPCELLFDESSSDRVKGIITEFICDGLE